MQFFPNHQVEPSKYTNLSKGSPQRTRNDQPSIAIRNNKK